MTTEQLQFKAHMPDYAFIGQKRETPFLTTKRGKPYLEYMTVTIDSEMSKNIAMTVRSWARLLLRSEGIEVE